MTTPIGRAAEAVWREAVAKVSGAEDFVGSLCRNLCRIGHFSTKVSTKFATKMQNHESSVPLLAPIIRGQPPAVLPTGMAIEEHEVGTQPMPGCRYSAFAAQDAASRTVRQMTGTPDVIQIDRADDVRNGEDGTPRAALVVGKIDRFDGLLDPVHEGKANYF